ncbi:transporter substrate-binding domain-containing protein [Gymnodinialimonas ceratoperidinii]|uniref:Transporter substrate-binding domain-containing protein n=1 Tax=Gymnodinialimonas ceratoperidinii TaxID=2856823 RepID=A0A8F6TYH7_9RHOB|nr:transporter substrate-binding domain-containing protein [Gymnodinialimonas ceratoperidinii]QXT40289.1 transporter substrate-binding domain-containing protein [Gymnodinialimonas ceratoperidinii]
MTMTRRLFGAALGVAAAMTALPAAAQSAAQQLASESVLTTIQEEGVIRIGLSIFTPWSMRDVNGDLIGFELDVGRALAEDMGVEVEFVPTAWDGIIPALLAGNFDVIISGMSITPQRNLTVNFTDPYAYSGMAILANASMTEGMTMDDYNSPDITFAARRGATPATVIANRFPEAELLLFDEDGAATQEVLNGNAHATMASQPTPDREARQYPDVLTVPFDELIDPTGEAFAVRKGDPDAMNFFNNWIAARTRSGWLEERHDYWFVGNEWADQVPE